jgi:uncharacterized membrane protein YhaH (DUF805 family)
MTQMSPIDWAKRPLQKYAVFSGRAPRAEYWWFTFAMIVVYLIASIVDNLLGLSGMIGGVYGPLALVVVLATLVPSIAVGARRLHDTNRTGWWLLVPAVPYVLALVLGRAALASGGGMASLGIAGLLMLVGGIAAILVIVFLVMAGTPGDNRYGPNPYGTGGASPAAA